MRRRVLAKEEESKNHRYHDLVENPEEAVMTDEERAALKALGYLD